MSDNAKRAVRRGSSKSGDGAYVSTGVPLPSAARRMSDPVVREFLLTFWKIHILHHAEEERGVYGMWMLEELSRHGYRLSPGTLYPILTRMARRGWIKAVEPKGARDARVYRITPAGAQVLERLRDALAELKGEVGDGPRAVQGRRSRSSAQRQAPRRMAPERR